MTAACETPATSGLRHEVSGAGDQTIVLIHELGGSLESWDGVVPRLAPFATVLRYDQRGAGRSDRPKAPVSLDRHVADLGELVHALDLPRPLHLVAGAAGALIALDFADRHPHDVASLVLCAPAIGADARRRAYLLERAEACLAGGMDAIADAALERSFPVALRGDGQRFARYRERFIGNDPASYAAANRLLAAADLDHAVAGLDSPCLVLAGTMDSLRPADELRVLAARFRHGRFATVDGGHLMAVQAPDAVAGHVEAFVAAHGQAARPARGS
ncbi:MAG: alpha/beta fold hydrolase [Rhizobiales bacterium]|nr:alpha/beta fold hydrolase [Hyphomicrobiales bacterium]